MGKINHIALFYSTLLLLIINNIIILLIINIDRTGKVKINREYLSFNYLKKEKKIYIYI